MDNQGKIVESDKIIPVKKAFIQSGLSSQLFLEMLAPANFVFLQSLGPARVSEGKECYFCIEIHGTTESEIRAGDVDDFENSYGTVFIYKDDYDKYLKNKIEFFSLPMAPSQDEVTLSEASLLVNLPEESLLAVLNLGLIHTNLEKDREYIIEYTGMIPTNYYNSSISSSVRIKRKALMEYATKHKWITPQDPTADLPPTEESLFPEPQPHSVNSCTDTTGYDPATADHSAKVREAARLEIENRKLPKEQRLTQAEMSKKILGTGYSHQDPTRQYRALRDAAIKEGLIPE